MGLVLAFALGFIASRLRLPPLVGYLLAGIVVGPYTPGITVDASFATDLSEIGVILLMFGVGLHFSMADLYAVRWIAVPGAIGQILLATAIGTAVAMSWGWSFGAGLVLGLSLSVASTVVLLRALDETNALATANGRIAVGWLIVEDLVMVLTLVLLPAFAGMLGGKAAASESSMLIPLGLTFAKLLLLGVIVGTIGPRFLPWMLGQAARTGSHELFTLCVLAVALGIAYGSAMLFEVSFALGAFAAGIVLAKLELSHRAAEEPLQHAFAVLFFVSVGMLFDPSVLLREPGAVRSANTGNFFIKSSGCKPRGGGSTSRRPNSPSSATSLATRRGSLVANMRSRAGDLFGEMALLSGGVRTADVTAIDYCLFLTLEQQDFELFVSRHPELRAKFDRIAAERAAMNTRELAVGTAPA